jgi:hypothetical protein
VRWRCSDGLDAREGVGNDVALSRDVPVVNWDTKSRWLNCLGEHLSRFCWKACVMGLWSVKMMKWRFQHVSEMFHGLVDGQQLSVVGAVLLLSWAQFFRDEG